MFVRNFFTKAVAEHTGCYAFFNGSVLDMEAYFRGCFAGNDFFYLQIEEGMWSKPFIRVKCFPVAWGYFLREVQLYNHESGLYESLSVNDKDMAFLRHVIKSCHAVIIKADKKWRERVAKMEDSEFEEIPYKHGYCSYLS